MTSKELAPLQGALDSILSRLSFLESKVGIEGAAPTAPVTQAAIVEGMFQTPLLVIAVLQHQYDTLLTLSRVFRFFRFM